MSGEAALAAAARAWERVPLPIAASNRDPEDSIDKAKQHMVRERLVENMRVARTACAEFGLRGMIGCG
ncbi:hypothetical protein [Sphingobium sp. BS19]|uniref:hypothetical protein n=1 Tax=Sphingobium sp. BS19 TaxID=3018973 RepID=UPI0022EE66B4|nr:hypothetical protein [Sphingobium sp. BS19]GLI98227.1 hypothetical protein Sbs19_20450 [Sphingobium sp. BS19]